MVKDAEGNLRRAAVFIAGAAQRQIEAAVIDQAKKCLLDWLGVSLGALDEPAATIVRRVALDWRSGGTARTLFGDETSATGAALVNGTLAHSLDFDDTHTPSLAHLSGPIWAAALAVGGDRHTDEFDLLRSFVTAFEVGGRLGGQRFGVAVDHAGWHSTGVFGALAATAAAASLMRLDDRACANALGAAATQVGGLTGSFGTMAKPFHAGKAAFNGVLSAELASHGFTASQTLCEPGGGLSRALVQHRDASALGWIELDEGCREILTNTFKPYACCLLTHAAVDAARDIAPGLVGREVRRVVASVSELATRLAAIGTPVTALEGKFSTAYCVALGLLGRRASHGDFNTQRMNEPGVRALVPKVELQAVAGMPETAAHLRVECTDGTVLEAEVPLARGNPGNPLDWPELEGKFRDLVEPRFDAARTRALIACVRNFETPGELKRLWSLIGVHSPMLQGE